MTEEEQRIRSYLTSQAAKLAPGAILEKVEAAMADLAGAAAAVPAARFAERPAADEWSANDVMAHVVAAGAHFGRGILCILDGRPLPPPAEARAEEAAPIRSAAAWHEILDQDRAVLFARVRGADPAARLDQGIEHGMFGTLNWRETLLFMRLHDLDHAGQLRKIAESLSPR